MNEYDKWTQPLTPNEIQLAKAEFIKFYGTLEAATCNDCALQRQNRCILQWDVYNTDGDCLLEK